MTYNDKFLEAYKQLEAELKYDSKTVLDYENSLQGTEQEQLKVCRIMRNYMSHNDMSFLETSANQVKFLNDLVTKIKAASYTVANVMKRIKTIPTTETTKSLLALVDKSKIVPMETSSGIYLIDASILVNQLNAGNKKIVLPKKLPKYKYTSKTTRIEDLDETLYIVTDTGTSTGKYVAILDLRKDS